MEPFLARRESNRSYSVRAVERAIHILGCFSFQAEEHTLGQISEMTNLSKSTAFRILQTLEKHRFVTYNPSSKHYSLGMKLFELGGVVSASLSLRKAASRFVDELEARISHMILVGSLEEGELVYIDKREGGDLIRSASEIGRRRPPYYGCLGMTLMAFLSDQEVDALLDRYPLEKIAPRSITDPKRFKQRLRDIRDKDYAYEHDEALPGLVGIAAPIRDHAGRVVAAIGVGIPKFKADKQKIRGTIELVKQTAKEISLALGFTELLDAAEK